MATATPVEQTRWQGIVVKNDPAARVYELRNVCFEVDLEGDERIERWQDDIKPNLPWADSHFSERVSGEPLNPGVEWRNWPWASSADKFRSPDERFNHTYMEHLWPKYARFSQDGSLPLGTDGERRIAPPGSVPPIHGICRAMGDLQDLIELLVRDPHTRQAWIPLFFPEDTGWADGGRKLCSLGYQFMLRNNRLHVWYPLRSCDWAHHFRDDCYLAIRLLIWVIERCRTRDPGWRTVVPGTLGFHATSLHVFENDRRRLLQENLR